jgi:hypothetical protein
MLDGGGVVIRNASMLVICLVWGTALLVAFTGIMQSGAISGPALRVSSSWSTDSALPRRIGGAQFVLVVHPHCPCARATLAELQRLRVRWPNPVLVVFVKPANSPQGWERSSLWSLVASLPGFESFCDEAGAEAKRLGAATSGHLFAFDATGRQVFQGGITPARGHEGPSRGGTELEDALEGRPIRRDASPVYGCPLF